jgi:hypothetical protein
MNQDEISAYAMEKPFLEKNHRTRTQQGLDR